MPTSGDVHAIRCRQVGMIRQTCRRHLHKVDMDGNPITRCSFGQSDAQSYQYTWFSAAKNVTTERAGKHGERERAGMVGE
jgi:hypothetical protein